MSLPETTLSNPLLDASYEQFLVVYSGIRPPGKTEVDRAAASLLTEGRRPPVSLVKRHVAINTPTLSRIGGWRVSPELAIEYLRGVGELCDEQQHSLQQTLEDLSATPHPMLAELPLKELWKDSTLVRSFAETLYWLNVVDRIVSSARERKWMHWEEGWFSRRLSLVPVESTYHLLTTDACLMFKDMMYSRFLIHLYCRLDASRSHLSQKLDEYVNWGEAVLLELGNEGYEVLKGVESLAQTALIAREETILDGEGQHQDMLDKYQAKEVAIGGNGQHVAALDSYLRSFASSRDLAEAFGFVKLWGHPYVDPVAGCVSAKTLAQQDLHLRAFDLKRLEWSFCHVYCRGFLKRTGRWPPLLFTPLPKGKPTQLELLYRRNQPALAFGFTQYPAKDWEWVTFAPHISFDEGEDILSLVVDKSLSYDRDHFDYTWGAKLDYRPPKPTTSNRVMEELITRQVIDLPAIVETVSKRNIPEAWKIVTVCPKEREMKLQPRMFSMMVLEMRLFFVLTEHNISKGIFRSLPEQTMTLSRPELLSLFLQSTRPSPGSWVKAVLGIDFSRWNLYWRAETVHPIGRRMDQMYGKEGVFSVVHDFFKESMCLLRLPDYPPDFLDRSTRRAPPEGRTLWYGHQGGFEGIAQKLWTSCTIALIHTALWPLGLSYKIIGQGDNQVCILDCYVPRELTTDQSSAHVRSLVEKAAKSISEVSKTMGHTVKLEECIYSTCFLTYGKEMILRGAYLPSALKYISRTFPSTTGDAPSLYEMISSISSGASGATERNDWSFPTYFLAKMVEGITLSREFRRSLFHMGKLKDTVDKYTGVLGEERLFGPSSKDLLRLSLAVPANLGGLPVTTVTEMLYRGHSDPLSSSLIHLCFLDKLWAVEQYKKVIWKGWLFKRNPDLVGLIQDPYSLPLDGTAIPSSKVSTVTSTVLPIVTNNQQFRELLDRSTAEDKDDLVTWLSTMLPMYPKIAHDLYKSSLVGLRDAFSRRFSNTRTILSLSRQSGISIVGVSLQADLVNTQNCLRRFHLVWKVSEASTTFTRAQLYSVVTTLRKVWTGQHLEGVTTAHPLAVGTLHWIPLGDYTPPASPCLVAVAMTSHSSDSLATRGPVTPYLGSATSDKSVAKWIRPIDTSPPLKDVLKILAIRSMVSLPSSTFYQGLSRLAQSRTTLPLDLLEHLLKIRIGGTIAHRYQTRDDSRGSFWNSCFNFPSHLTFSTNLAGDLGRRDYPYDFQEAMLSMASLMSWTFPLVEYPPNWGLCMQVDLSQMTEVGDHVVDSQPYRHRYQDCPHNYYASVLDITISSNAQTAARFQKGQLRMPWTEENVSVRKAIATVVLYHFRRGSPTTTRYGHALGIPQAQRIIDCPEVTYIQTPTMVEALTDSLWFKIGLPLALMCQRRGRTPEFLLQTLLDLEVRKGFPSLAGTLREVDGGLPLFGLGVGLGRENESAALGKWMSYCLDRAPGKMPSGPYPLYENGTSSISSLLSSYLGVLAAKECLSMDPPRFKAGKLLARLVQRCTEEPEEQGKVRLLNLVIQAAHLESYFCVTPSSPEEILRGLRSLPSPQPVGQVTFGRVRRLYRPPTWNNQPVGGTAKLSLPSASLSASRLYRSWSTRLLHAPAPAERWSPLSSLHPQDHHALLLGVGAGDIGGALPPSWKVTGVELAAALQNLGHSFTTYIPPGLGDRFRLHPCSWTTSGDITRDDVLSLLEKELRRGKYTLVLMDVEQVRNEIRLAVRRRLAMTGIPTYCKVLLDPADVDLFLQSWVAYRAPQDVLWTTDSYPGCEFIVGTSDSPIGVYAAVPSVEVVSPVVPPPSAPGHRPEVLGYPPYNRGADLLVLTGHLPALTSRGLQFPQCRALFPFVTGLHPFSCDEAVTSLEPLALHLVASGCPRSRVRALITLYRHGFLSTTFSSEASLYSAFH